MPFIDYDITTSQYDAARKAMCARKAMLGIGAPTLCYNMQKKIRAAGDRICMIDGTPINTDALTQRDLGNFLGGTRSTAPKMFVILGYLALLETPDDAG